MVKTVKKVQTNDWQWVTNINRIMETRMIISRDGRGTWKHFCTTVSKSADPLNGLSIGEDIIGA